MKYYVTFGQTHRHKIKSQLFDADCVGVLFLDAGDYSKAREVVSSLFGRKFCMVYDETTWEGLTHSYRYDGSYPYPKGYIEIHS